MSDLIFFSRCQRVVFYSIRLDTPFPLHFEDLKDKTLCHVKDGEKFHFAKSKKNLNRVPIILVI